MKCFVVSLLLFVGIVELVMVSAQDSGNGDRYGRGISSSQDANNNHDPQTFGHGRGYLSIEDTDPQGYGRPGYGAG